MWAIGVYDLRLNSEEWGRLTLVEFDTLLKRHSFFMESQLYQTGMICSSTYNANGAKKRGGGLFTPDDFMGKEEKSKTWQDNLKKVETLNKLFGGIDKRSN